MVNIEHLIFAASVLLLLAVLAGKASGRVGIPPVLLFLVLGMLAGSEGLGGIYFDNPWLTQLVGTIALALILFSGGLDTDWQSVRPVLRSGLALSTLGVLITAGLVAGFAVVVLHMPWLEGLLLGAIVSPTDAAAVFSVMNASRVRLKGRLLPLLELESGSNDPMAIFLTIGVTQLLIAPRSSAVSLLPLFIEQMGVGAALGLGLGKLMVLLVNRVKLEVSGPYPVLTTASVLVIYGATASVGGSGFLAVYLAGIIMGNSQVAEAQSVAHFHGGLAALMEIAMFLTLGLLDFPSHLIPIIGVGMLLTVFLIVIARPLSVFVSLALSRDMTWRDKTFVSWVGLRGAVPIILATIPRLAGVPVALLIFDLVFFTVLVSVLVQGSTIPLAARWLKVAEPDNSPDALP
jgi:potassium/hydrogen antiporter